MDIVSYTPGDTIIEKLWTDVLDSCDQIVNVVSDKRKATSENLDKNKVRRAVERGNLKIDFNDERLMSRLGQIIEVVFRSDSLYVVGSMKSMKIVENDIAFACEVAKMQHTDLYFYDINKNAWLMWSASCLPMSSQWNTLFDGLVLDDYDSVGFIAPNIPVIKGFKPIDSLCTQTKYFKKWCVVKYTQQLPQMLNVLKNKDLTDEKWDEIVNDIMDDAKRQLFRALNDPYLFMDKMCKDLEV